MQCQERSGKATEPRRKGVQCRKPLNNPEKRYYQHTIAHSVHCNEISTSPCSNSTVEMCGEGGRKKIEVTVSDHGVCFFVLPSVMQSGNKSMILSSGF